MHMYIYSYILQIKHWWQIRTISIYIYIYIIFVNNKTTHTQRGFLQMPLCPLQKNQPTSGALWHSKPPHSLVLCLLSFRRSCRCLKDWKNKNHSTIKKNEKTCWFVPTSRIFKKKSSWNSLTSNSSRLEKMISTIIPAGLDHTSPLVIIPGLAWHGTHSIAPFS